MRYSSIERADGSSVFRTRYSIPSVNWFGPSKQLLHPLETVLVSLSLSESFAYSCVLQHSGSAASGGFSRQGDRHRVAGSESFRDVRLGFRSLRERSAPPSG